MGKRLIRHLITIRFNTARKPIQFHADALNVPRLIEELLGTDESRAGARYAFKLDDGSYTTVNWDDVSFCSIAEENKEQEGYFVKKLIRGFECTNGCHTNK